MANKKKHHFSTLLSYELRLLNNKYHLKDHIYVVKFIIVGGLGFIFNSLVLIILTHYHVNKVLSEAIAILLALQLTFILHDRWTYAELGQLKREYSWKIIRRYAVYLVSNSFGSVLTLVLFALFSMTLSKLIALALAAAIAMVWNFTINKLVVWRKEKELVEEDIAEAILRGRKA